MPLRLPILEFPSARSCGLKNPDTILSYGLGTEAGPILTIGDARQNYTQRSTMSAAKAAGTSPVGAQLPISPPNVGANVTTPAYNDANGQAVSGATTFGLPRHLHRAGHRAPLGTGEVVWAGPRDDGFYADTPGIFDLLDSRILDNNGTLADGLGQDGGGVDGFQGFNVLTFGIQIPSRTLPEPSNYNDAFAGAQSTGVGVYASVSRQRVTIRRSNGDSINAGDWVQVNRMGNPLFNEALVPLGDKDNYNRAKPIGDAAFATYAENSELAVARQLPVRNKLPDHQPRRPRRRLHSRRPPRHHHLSPVTSAVASRLQPSRLHRRRYHRRHLQRLGPTADVSATTS